MKKKSYKDGKYTGFLLKDQRNGKGRMEYNDGTYYDGIWAKDKKQGKGTHTYPSRIQIN